MVKIYETLRNLGRRYVAPAILGATLLIGGCGKEEKVRLPISEETKEIYRLREELSEKKKLELMTEEYNILIDSAEKDFNLFIRDGRLNISEQREIYCKLKAAEEISQAIVKKRKDMKDYERLQMPKSDKRLYKLLEKNLEGQDVGIPNLEEELRKEGINIEVEPYLSVEEICHRRVSPIYYFILGVIGAKLFFGAIRKQR